MVAPLSTTHLRIRLTGAFSARWRFQQMTTRVSSLPPNSHKNSVHLIWFPAQIGYPRSAYRTTAMSRSWDRLAAAVLGGRMPEGRREAGLPTGIESRASPRHELARDSRRGRRRTEPLRRALQVLSGSTRKSP